MRRAILFLAFVAPLLAGEFLPPRLIANPFLALPQLPLGGITAAGSSLGPITVGTPGVWTSGTIAVTATTGGTLVYLAGSGSVTSNGCPTDSASNTYTADPNNPTVSGRNVIACIAKNITGGSLTVTTNCSGCGVFTAAVIPMTGASSSAPLATSASTTTVAPSSSPYSPVGTITFTSAPTLLIEAISANGSSACGSGWTQVDNNGSVVLFCYKNSSSKISSGSDSYTYTSQPSAGKALLEAIQ